MNSRVTGKLVLSLAVLAAGVSLAFAGQETFEGLKVTTDNGKITGVVVSNPETYLGIEAEFSFSVSRDGTPSGRHNNL